MAAADFNEDDFEDYNPQPYLGGYDITVTYGSPLPPSPAICYPLSSPAPLPQPPREISPEIPRPPPELPPPSPELPPPYDYGEPSYGYGYGHYPEPHCPDLFRSWPFGGSENGVRGDDVAENGFWNQWKRGLDYLFGHAQGYGERRIGVDSYGIPIYANKRHGSQPIRMEIEPVSDRRLDYYDTESCSSAYGGGTEESHANRNPGCAYRRHHYEQPLCVQVDPNELWCLEKQSYLELSHEQFSSLSGESPNESPFFSDPTYAYKRHYYEEPMTVQVEPIEPYRSTSYEVYQDSASPEFNWHSSFENEQGDEGNYFGNSNYAYEKHTYEQSNHVELEPSQPSWFPNRGTYEAYGEPTSPRSSWVSSLFGELRTERNDSRNTNDSYAKQYPEQLQFVPLEPFMPTAFQNQTYYADYNDVSTKTNHGDDSNGGNDAKNFWPFQKYLAYEE